LRFGYGTKLGGKMMSNYEDFKNLIEEVKDQPEISMNGEAQKVLYLSLMTSYIAQMSDALNYITERLKKEEEDDEKSINE
jgi:hypothetical protein